MYNRYDQLAYQYRIPVPNVNIQPTHPSGGFILSGTSPIAGSKIRYTTDGTIPNKRSSPLPESEDGTTGLAISDKSTLAKFRAATFDTSGNRHSLLFQHIDASNKYAKHGTLIGKWKSGKIGNKKAKEVIFDATGHINSNGEYIVTFLYTGGRERLDIDSIEVVRNDTTPVDKDIHHGYTGGSRRDNTYHVRVKNYETGASFKIKAMIYGDEGDDSNGVVLIRRK